MSMSRRAERFFRSGIFRLLVLYLSLGLSASFVLPMNNAAHAGELVSSELRIKSAFWDDAVFPNIVDSGASTSPTSVFIANRTLPSTGVGSTPGPDGHHMHFFGNDFGRFDGAAPGQVGGDLRFFGDWGLGQNSIFFQPWTIGADVSTDFGNASPWTAGPASTSGGAWFVINPAGTSYVINTAGTAFVTQMAGPITAIGSNALTPSGNGSITVVAPMRFVRDPAAGGDPIPTVGAIGELTLVFAPEPSLVYSFGAGAILIFLLGRRRLMLNR